MDKKDAQKIAEPVVKRVVDLIAERKYEEIQQVAELADWSVENVREAIDGFLELNELPHMDPFDAPCNFHPQYEYHQLECYVYKDGSGFAMDYNLTTDSELNDLTLQMEFLCTEDGFKARFLQVHVL